MEADLINNPKHYSQAGDWIEPIDVIHNGPFDLCNVIKYLARAGHKDNELQDIQKAEYYVLKAVESYFQDQHPYDYWFKRNALLIRKIGPFRNFRRYNVYELILESKNIIDNKLKKLGVK